MSDEEKSHPAQRGEQLAGLGVQSAISAAIAFASSPEPHLAPFLAAGAFLANVAPAAASGAGQIIRRLRRDERVQEVIGPPIQDAFESGRGQRIEEYRDAIADIAASAEVAESDAKRDLLRALLSNTLAIDDSKLAVIEASEARAMIDSMSEAGVLIFGYLARATGDSDVVVAESAVRFAWDEKFADLPTTTAMIGIRSLHKSSGPLVTTYMAADRWGLTEIGIWLREKVKGGL